MDVQRWFSARRLAFVPIALLVFVLFAAPALAGVLKVGDVLPDSLQVTDYEGNTIKLKEATQGKKSLIIFFNTSCRQCLQEIKFVLNNYGGENNILVAIDMAGKPLVERWQKKRLKDYPQANILLDPEFTVPMKFGLSLTPSSVFVNADGTIAIVKPGFDKSGESEIAEFYK